MKTETDIVMMHLQASNHWKPEVKQGMDSALQTQEGIKPANNLISDFCPPGLWENKFLLILVNIFEVICYNSPHVQKTQIKYYFMKAYLILLD